MTATSIRKERMAQLCELIAELAAVDPAEVESSESFPQDLDLDSMLGIELLVRLEKRFGVEIPTASVERMTTLELTYQVVAECSGWAEE